jgi:hypothetical protein
MNLLPLLVAVSGLFAGHGAALTQEARPPAAAPSPALPDPVALVMEKHHATADCEDPQSEHMRDHPGISAEIGPTSVLYAVPCTQSAGRVSYRLYAHETGEIGGVKALYFARYSGAHGWTGTDLLVDITVDGPGLQAFLPADDGSACGHGTWTFVDYAYRLDRFAIAARCDRRPLSDWTIVYPEEGP